MFEKIFAWMNSVTDNITEKKYNNFIKENKHRIFMWGIMLFLVITGVSTYVVGECVDCRPLTQEEVDMLFDRDSDNTKLTQYLETREYIPISDTRTFIKLWMVSFVPGALIFSLLYFGVVFVGMLFRKMVMKYYNKFKIKK